MKLRINPIRCVAHGLCAELLPEHVTLDEWGYPILDGKRIEPEMEWLARRAADACPTLAVMLKRDEPQAAMSNSRTVVVPPIRGDGDGGRREPLAAIMLRAGAVRAMELDINYPRTIRNDALDACPPAGVALSR